MGVAMGEGPAAALRLAIDDAGVRATPGYRRAVRGYGYPSATRYSWRTLAAGNLLLGALFLSEHRAYGWLWLGMAAAWVAMPRRGRGAYADLNGFTIPMEFSVGDAGIAYAVCGKSAPISVSWRAVRSVTKTADAFVVELRAWLARPLYVPRPPEETLAAAMWATFYTHLVATRGLRPTPPDRLAVITNTAAV